MSDRRFHLYLAGPMTGVPLFNYPAFDDRAARLRSMGYRVTSPAEETRALGFDETDPSAVFAPEDYRQALVRATVALERVNGVALLPGWEQSPGARYAVSYADDLMLPSYPTTEWIVRASGGLEWRV